MNTTLNISEYIPDQISIQIPLKILAVDDSVVNQILMKKIFSKLGYDIDLAVNGLEALHSCKNKKYDLILMDLQMPEMDGFEASIKIRDFCQNNISPYIVALTGDNSIESKNKLQEHGINGYLSKPIIISEIYKIIQKEFYK